MKRIRRLQYPKGANGVCTPLFAAAILITTAILAFAAWPPESAEQSSAAAQRQEEATLAPGIVQLKPFPTEPLRHFQMAADSRRVFESLAGLADLNVAFSPDYQGQSISVDLTNVRIEEALRVVSHQTRSFWKPLTSNTILVIPDNPNNRREYADHGETSPYDRWLNEEVVYIITDKERAAFQELTTDEERNKFIEQFWERRNPNPGSPENKFKKEFYRRIAYTNEHFTSAKPGWKTDRGYMYIAYGPPDEITGTNYGPAPGPHIPYGIQVWTYRHVKDVGDDLSVTFMDWTGTGDYELPPDPR